MDRDKIKRSAKKIREEAEGIETEVETPRREGRIHGDPVAEVQ